MNEIFEAFLLGAIAAGSAVVALFFLKFWRSTRDGLFLAFAGAFGIECVLRVARVFYLSAGQPDGGLPWVYLFRLAASLLILMAIVRKNVGKKGKGSSGSPS